MHTKKFIYDHLVNVLVELFELEAKNVRPEALLVEDLDIDSIDAVDIALQMQELTGDKIEPAEFKDIQTVQDLVDAIYRLPHADSAEASV